MQLAPAHWAERLCVVHDPELNFDNPAEIKYHKARASSRLRALVAAVAAVLC
jgi:hypothetical protein